MNSIDRDIEFMRSRLGYSIEWRRKGKTSSEFAYFGHGPKRRVL